MIEILRGDENDLHVFFMAHDDLEIDFDTFKNQLKEWNVFVIRQKTPVAVVIEKDGAAHIASYNKKRVGMSVIRQAAKMLNVKKSSVEINGGKRHLISKRLGFNIEKIENGIVFYSL